MAEVKSQWWWVDRDKKNDSTPIRRSPWLNSALSELDEKTKAMLRIIEEDADSFAMRAEMYYKKRPELITMVEDFYRTHRSLAERYDQLKTDPSFRNVITPWSQKKQQLMTFSDKSYDSYSEKTYDPMEDCESDVDDPEQDQIYGATPIQVQYTSLILPTLKDDPVSIPGCVRSDDVAKLREEIERLKEENRVQKEKLEEKDEEKREVIRQLSIAIDGLKEETLELRKKICVARKTPKKESSLEFLKLKDMFTGKLFK